MGWFRNHNNQDEVLDDLVEFNREKDPRYSRTDAEDDYRADPLRACAAAELQRRRKEGWTPDDFERGYKA